MKVCRSCKIEKELKCFNKCSSSSDKLQWYCRDCYKIYTAKSQRYTVKIYRQEESKQCSKCLITFVGVEVNKNFYKAKLLKDGLYGYCRDCSKIGNAKRQRYTVKIYRQEESKQCYTCLITFVGVEVNKNFHKRDNSKDGLNGACKKCRCIHMKAYNNIPEVKVRINKTNLKYQKNKRLTDPLFKLACNLRSLVYISITGGGWKKSSKTQEILGCSFDFAMAWLIESFYRTYGYSPAGVEVEIDHIIPVSSANTADDMVKLNHITNLRYLKAEDNQSKFDKYGQNEINLLEQNKSLFERVLK